MTRVLQALALVGLFTVPITGRLAQAPAPARQASTATGQTAVEYRLSFPEPEHRWMRVEATFRDLPATPLEIRMSRTSPGRYALHEFAKNVFDVEIRNGRGAAMMATRPDLHQWTVAGHDGTVTISYRVFGDRIDGTYLSVDSTHAHMNLPATLVWARGLEARPAQVRFEQPPGRQWRVATQLYPTTDPLVFTAPNLAYLLDSPTEFSAHTVRSFTVPNPSGSGPAPTIRIALHHDGTDADADAYAADVQKIARETAAIFGEFPQFENNTYTFLADYLPWAAGDGMEHRNSTILTSAGALRNPAQRTGLLGTVAHEFVHAWNVERIRPGDLEPFDFEHADVSSNLWFGEGVTSYYDDLIMRRTGLMPLADTLASFAGTISAVENGPGRQFRSPQDMSRLAPFVDAAVSIDRTNWENTFISYYTYGAALGLAMDLGLRQVSGGSATLDTYMRAMWARFGRPGQKVPGVVATPYTAEDLKNVFVEVSGNRAFAERFFADHIEGRGAVDYAPLLAQAGFVLRRRGEGQAFLTTPALNTQGGGGARVMSYVAFGSALYAAGVERDDLLVALDGTNLAQQGALAKVLAAHKPGDRVGLRFVRRSGETMETSIELERDPRYEIVPIEDTPGGQVSDAHKRFRDAWLGARAAGTP